MQQNVEIETQQEKVFHTFKHNKITLSQQFKSNSESVCLTLFFTLIPLPPFGPGGPVSP